MKVLLSQDEVDSLSMVSHSVAGEPDDTYRGIFSSSYDSISSKFKYNVTYTHRDIYTDKFLTGKVEFL